MGGCKRVFNSSYVVQNQEDVKKFGVGGYQEKFIYCGFNKEIGVEISWTYLKN